MNAIKRRMIVSCTAIALSACALLAGAQEHHWADCKDQADHAKCQTEQMEKFQAMHAAKLHDELKITPQQEAAWTTFSASFHPPAMSQEMPARPSRADMEKLSAPEKLEQHLAMQQKHLADMQAHLTALKSLYAVLTPDQQAMMNKHMEKMARHHHDHHHHCAPWMQDEHHEHQDHPAAITPVAK